MISSQNAIDYQKIYLKHALTTESTLNIYLKLIFYRFDSALPLVHIFLRATFPFSNRIGRLAKTPNAIRANESVVNLAMPHCDEAKAIIDSCMSIPIL